ncbi:MAG: hypothetical protein ABSB86_14400 [Bryobacteraceae bacterium]
MKAERGLITARMAEAGRRSSSSFYRYDEDAAPRPDRDMDLRDVIQRIALDGPATARHHNRRV